MLTAADFIRANLKRLHKGLDKALAHTERTTGRDNIRHLDSSIIAQQVIAVYERVTGKKITSELIKEPDTKDKVHVEN